MGCWASSAGHQWPGQAATCATHCASTEQAPSYAVRQKAHLEIVAAADAAAISSLLQRAPHLQAHDGKAVKHRQLPKCMVVANRWQRISPCMGRSAGRSRPPAPPCRIRCHYRQPAMAEARASVAQRMHRTGTGRRRRQGGAAERGWGWARAPEFCCALPCRCRPRARRQTATGGLLCGQAGHRDSGRGSMSHACTALLPITGKPQGCGAGRAKQGHCAQHDSLITKLLPLAGGHCKRWHVT